MDLNKDKDSCRQTLYTRLHSIHDSWYRAAKSYHDINQFLICINSCIQELRNVTFIIQKNKKLLDGFDDWYSPNVDRMKTDQVMVWVKNSRNRIVKESDLELHSIAYCTAENWESNQIATFKVSPILDNSEIVIGVQHLISEKLRKRSEELGGLALKIERVFIDKEYPEREILELLSHAYCFSKDISLDFMNEVGIAVEEFNFEKDERILNQVVDEKFRVLWADLDTGAIIKSNQQKVELPSNETLEKLPDREKFLELADRYKGRKGAFERMEYDLEFAKLIISGPQAEFLPQLVLYSKEDKILGLKNIMVANRSQKYAALNDIAQIIASNKNIYSICLTYEAWVVENKRYSAHLKGQLIESEKKEAITVVSLDKNGRCEQQNCEIHREGNGINFGESIIIEHLPYPGILKPIYKVWNIPWDNTSHDEFNKDF